jgi:hypothetical protein
MGEVHMNETDRKVDMSFAAEQHALLFAWVAREAVALAGEQAAAPALRAAVRRYGEERGHRMALRARQDGQPLSMAVYLSYREWDVPARAMQQTGAPRGSALYAETRRCPWATVWQKEGLTNYGRYFCEEIDSALVRGFNPELIIDVHGTRTSGSRSCRFTYHDAFNGALVHEDNQRPEAARRLPWSYHTAHLYATMRSVLEERLGTIGRAACDAGLATFGARFGSGMADYVRAHAEDDFDRLPEGA